MKRLALIVAALALPLGGCDTLSNVAASSAGLPASPAAVCDRSQWDENAGIGVETAYKAWRIAVEAALDANWIKGAFALRIAELDNKAYAFTLATQKAYDACNAASYLAASRSAIAALKDGIAALRTKGQ